MTIRVLVADDQRLIRAGFSALVDSADDLEVVGEAVDGADAVRQARSARPDVVLMDIRMPGMDGLSATESIVADPDLQAVRILVLTTFEADEYVVGALRAGASGFLGKGVEPEELLAAIRVVAQGETLLSPRATSALVGPVPGSAQRRCERRGRRVAGCADRSRARGRRAGRPRAQQRRDRRAARRLAPHRQDPRQPGDDQARRPGPGPARGAGLPLRSRAGRDRLTPPAPSRPSAGQPAGSGSASVGSCVLVVLRPSYGEVTPVGRRRRRARGGRVGPSAGTPRTGPGTDTHPDTKDCP